MVFTVLLPKTLTSVEAQSLLTVETQSLLNRFLATSFLGGAVAGNWQAPGVDFETQASIPFRKERVSPSRTSSERT